MTMFGPILPQNIIVEAITMPGDIQKYDLVANFLRMRKRVFVDRMAWPLHHAEDVEFEQYDTFDTTYILAHDGEMVLGGARLRRTDRRSCAGSVRYSYMIRDACLGLLPGMPSNICHDLPPLDEKTWELTRFVAEPKANVAERILEVADSYLFSVGAERCLFLGPPAFMRMASRLGWSPEALGDVVGNTDGRFVAFSCNVHVANRACTSAH
ncbi:acyl-homoserine-lactone synthase [uncultured Paracoccus sp.]|uniref:acyl-homoserine-lactone synthase n=1 Tax=uncultured Paracoccus sp. TaxID=189685 RepID=UPI00260881E8|nr:acyl-homoserine-lactone synthase [uncultured Paracoccus sp.]